MKAVVKPKPARKQTKKDVAKKPIASKKRDAGQAKKDYQAAIAALKRENKKLRGTIADVWAALNEVGAADTSAAMFGVIDEACDYIITDLPHDYWYEDQDEPADDAKRRAATVKVAQARAQKEIAKELGVSMPELEKIEDPNITLPAARKIFAARYGLDESQFGSMTPEEYQTAVAFYFALTVFLTAKTNFTLRGEMKRYIAALEKFRGSFPKGKRKPGADVQKMLDTFCEGGSMGDTYSQAITTEAGYDKDYDDMNPIEKRNARKKLKNRVGSTKRNREDRAKK